MKVFLEIPVLGYRWINLGKEEKGVLSVISRPGGVHFMPRYRVSTYAQSALYLIPLFPQYT